MTKVVKNGDLAPKTGVNFKGGEGRGRGMGEI